MSDLREAAKSINNYTTDRYEALVQDGKVFVIAKRMEGEPKNLLTLNPRNALAVATQLINASYR